MAQPFLQCTESTEVSLQAVSAGLVPNCASIRAAPISSAVTNIMTKTQPCLGKSVTGISQLQQEMCIQDKQLLDLSQGSAVEGILNTSPFTAT